MSPAAGGGLAGARFEPRGAPPVEAGRLVLVPLDDRAELSAPLPVRPECPTCQVARTFEAADATARARMLAALAGALGTLGLAAVAAGAFADLARRKRLGALQVSPSLASRYTAAQVMELARFVMEVDPDVLHRLAGASPGTETSQGTALPAHAATATFGADRPAA